MKLWIKISLSGVVILALVMVYIYFFVYNKPHKDYEKAKPAYILTAEDLFYSYINNRAESETRYNGKVLLINGQLSSSEQTQDMTILNFSFIEGLFGDEGVRCTMLDNHVDKAKQLTPGTEVTVKGLCTGFSGSDVILEFCSIQ